MTAWPLDNTEYTAEAIGAWSGTRTRGVFSADSCFAVTSAGGFGILVSAGLAWLKAAEYWGMAVLEKSETAFTVDVGSGLLPRYVAVALQYDKVANEARLALRYGEYGSPAVKPQPVRDEHYDEIILASILQRAAAVEITQADITDERLDEDMCGVMRDGVTGIPTAQLLAQARDKLDRYDAEFAAWFENIKGQLSGDVAGNLQIQVDDLSAEVRLFSALLLADGWEQEDGGDAAAVVYTQTAPCPGLLAAYDLEAPQAPVVGVQATDAALKEGLDALCEAGNSGETLDGYLKWTCYGSCPTVDLPLRLRRAAMEADTGEDGGGQEAAPEEPGEEESGGETV